MLVIDLFLLLLMKCSLVLLALVSLLLSQTLTLLHSLHVLPIVMRMFAELFLNPGLLLLQLGALVMLTLHKRFESLLGRHRFHKVAFEVFLVEFVLFVS